MKSASASYKAAGVDIRGAGDFIRAIQPLVSLTRRSGFLRGPGTFGGLFGLNGSAKGKILVASADGVGTKLRLAQRVGLYEPLGVDLVAMNVNDILCAGAEPLFFLDYIAAGRLNPKVLMGVVRGIVRGCAEAHCALLGGETAQMPLVYSKKDFDLAGFAVGIVDRKDLVTGEKVRMGDKVIGLASNGVHANGFTLIQKLLSSRQLRAWAQELLRPTRIYVRPVLGLLRSGMPIRGIAHITGGSFREKIPRVLPEGCAIVLRKKGWSVPRIFRRLQAAGISEEEMYRTFNMGIGMVLIVPPSGALKVQRALTRGGCANWAIGEVIRGRQREVMFS